MALGKSQDQIQDQFNLQVNENGNKFSRVDLDTMATVIKKYIGIHSDKFHDLMNKNPKISLDYILDNAGSFLDDMFVSPDKGEKEIWEEIRPLLIDAKIAGFDKEVESDAVIAQSIQDLKDLQISIGGPQPVESGDVVTNTVVTTSGADEVASKGKDTDPNCIDCDNTKNRGDQAQQNLIQPDQPGNQPDTVPGKQGERLEDRAGPDNQPTRVLYGPLKGYVPGQGYYVQNRGEDGGENTRYDIADHKEKKAMKNLFLGGVRGFLNRPEKEVDMVVEGEKIGPKHKNELKQFWKAVRKMGVENFGEYFIDVRDAYGAGQDITSKDFWKDSNYSMRLSGKKEAKLLALIGTIYDNYRNLEEKPYSGTYMERLIGTIENDIADNAREGNTPANNTSYQSFDASESYNKHNDNVEINFADPDRHILINKNSRLNESLNIDERRGVKELFDLNGDQKDGIYGMDAVMRLVRLQEHNKASMANIINAVPQGKKLIGPDGKTLNKDEIELYDTWQTIKDHDTGSSTQRMVMEGLSLGMRPEYIANVKMLIDEASLDHKQYGNKVDGGKITPEVHFVGCIEDVIVNGKTDFGDKGMTSGLQFRSLFQTAVNEIEFDQGCSHHAAEQKAVYNIVCFVAQKALELGYRDLHFQLQAVLATAQNGQLDANALVTKDTGFLSQHPGYLKGFQDIMLQSPVPVDAIMKYGNSGFVENQKQTAKSFELYAQQLSISKEQLDKINNFASKQWKKLMSEAAERNMTDIVQGEREAVVNQINAAVIDYALQNRIARGAGVGFSKSLDNTLKGLSAHLSLGVVDGSGSDASPLLGFSLGHHVALGGEGSSWSLNTSAGSSLTFAGFTPFLGQSIAKERELNKNKLKKTLDAKPLVTAHVGAKYGIVMLGPVVSPAVGIHTGIDINRQAGIEREYVDVRKRMKTVTNRLFAMPDLLPDLKAMTPDYAVLFAKKKSAVDMIAKELKKTFPDSKQDMRQAAENLYKGMLYFACMDNTRDKLHAADMLAEYYAVQWKNMAIEKTRGGFSGFDLGVDYIIAVSLPILSAAVSFEKYYTSVYQDSKESLQDIENAKNYGRGNRLKSKTIGDDEIDFLNAQLTSYARKTAGAEPTIELEKRDGIELLKLPIALYAHNRAEVCIDSALKGCLLREGEYFYIPKSTIVRLGSFAAGQNTGYTLNLGDNKTEVGDMRLQAGRGLDPSWFAVSEEAFLANVKEYAKQAGEIRVLTSTNLTQTFANLRQGAYGSFPQLQAEGTVTNGHINVKLENGFVYKYNSQVVNGMISVPTTGTLSVAEKIVNGQSEYYFTHTPGNSLLKVQYTTERLQANRLLTKEKINTNPAMQTLYANPVFPLSMVDSVDANNISFNLKNGMNVTSYSPVAISGTLLSVPLGHKLIIEYNPTSKNYSARSLALGGNLQSFACNFIVLDGKTPEQHCEIDNLLQSYQDTSYIDTIRDTIFSPQNVLNLSELEDLSENKKLYYQFMEMLNSSVKQTISENDIDAAVTLLKSMLSNGLKDSVIAPTAQIFITLIDSFQAGGDYDRKTYVINKMKQVFSLEDKAYIGKTLNTLFTARASVYDALAQKESFGSNFTTAWYKKNFADLGSTKFEKGKYVSYQDVIGFTAYYRNSGGVTQNKGFSLSGLGDVNIYGSVDKPAIQKLDGNEKTLAKEWFINKLAKNVHEYFLTKKSYEDKVRQVPGLSNFVCDDDIFNELLNGKAVTINGKEVSVKADMVAYLQGECCNQGLGMKINNICYSDGVDIIETIIKENGEIEAVSEEVVGDTHGGRLYVSTPYTRGIATKERKETTIGFALADPGRPREPHAVSNPGDSRYPDVPGTGGDTGPGDGNNPDPNANNTGAGKR